MMYKPLQIYKYMHPTQSLEREYNRRIKNPLTVVTSLNYFIDGFTFPLYLVPIQELIIRQNIIYQQSIDIMQVVNQLSPLARHEFFWGNLRKEIRTTNKIEGLHTTAHEINTAISAISSQKKHAHFKPFAKMYWQIHKRQGLHIYTLQDIRNIYNHLFTGILPNKIFPKSTLFRNSFVRIGTSFSTAYQPKSTEKEFEPDLRAWIKFINARDVSPIIKACIAHFFFESIHPFNDGNGRIGRYILCTYLANKIDQYTAISFSQEINRNEKLYYNAFKPLNNPINHGEVTFFVLNIMTIILNSQKHLMKSLSILEMKYKNITHHITTINIGHLSKQILKLLIVIQVFNQKSISPSISQIRCIFRNAFTPYMIRSRVNSLIDRKLLERTSKKPLSVRIPIHILYKWQD